MRTEGDVWSALAATANEMELLLDPEYQRMVAEEAEADGHPLGPEAWYSVEAALDHLNLVFQTLDAATAASDPQAEVLRRIAVAVYRVLEVDQCAREAGTSLLSRGSYDSN